MLARMVVLHHTTKKKRNGDHHIPIVFFCPESDHSLMSLSLDSVGDQFDNKYMFAQQQQKEIKKLQSRFCWKHLNATPCSVVYVHACIQWWPVATDWYLRVLRSHKTDTGPLPLWTVSQKVMGVQFPTSLPSSSSSSSPSPFQHILFILILITWWSEDRFLLRLSSFFVQCFDFIWQGRSQIQFVADRFFFSVIARGISWFVCFKTKAIEVNQGETYVWIPAWISVSWIYWRFSSSNI